MDRQLFSAWKAKVASPTIGAGGSGPAVWSCEDLSGGQWNQEDVLASQGETTTWSDPDATSTIKFYRIEVE